MVQLNGSNFVLPGDASALTGAGAFVVTGNTSNGGAVPIGYSYDPGAANLDFLAAGDSLTITYAVKVNDGTTDSATQNVTFTITGTNDAPVLAAAIADQSSAEDNAWSFAVPAGTFTDVDHGTTLTYTATLDDGNALPGWLAFSAATQTFSGTPPLDFNGSLQLKVTASDGSLSASDTFQLTITPVNDAPVNTVPGAKSATAGAATSIVGVSVNDVDSATVTTTLSVGHGTISVLTGTGATVDTNGTSSVTVSGTQAQVNAAIAGLSYTATAGYTGADTLNVNTSDGALTDSDNVAITVSAPVVANIKFVPNVNEFSVSLPNGAIGSFVAYDAAGNVISGATFTTAGITSPLTVAPNGAVSGNLGNNNTATFTVTSGAVTETVNLLVGTGTGNNFSGGVGIDIMFGVNGDDTLNGGDNDDTLYGNDVGDTLNGGANDDFLIGGNNNDILNGDSGNDYLRGGDGADTLTGGAGIDSFVLSNIAVTSPGPANIDTIVDYASGDVIDITQILSVNAGTNVITGGFVRVTTTGLVQVDTNGATGGQTWVTLSNVNTGAGPYAITYVSGGVATTVNVTPVAPPIALDLNGDGVVSFLDSGAGAAFDYGAGTVATAWVAPEDAILVRDANHDGQVSSTEIVFATDGSDLQGLAVYDSDGDGQLSAADTSFGEFAVWQDADSDGVVDTGELRSLTAEGIASISLSSDGIGYSAAGGDVSVVGTGSFTRADGSTGLLADAVFATAGRVADDPLRSATAANSNIALLAAVAAAGIAAAPVAAAAHEPSGAVAGAQEVGLAAPSAVPPDHSAQADGPSIAPAVAVSSDLGNTSAPASTGPGEHDLAQADHSLVRTETAEPAGPTALLQDSEAPAEPAAATQTTANAVAMPSADALAAAFAADSAHGTQEVSRVLADALGGGGTVSKIDAFLEAVLPQLGGDHAAIAALGAEQVSASPGGEMGSIAGLAIGNGAHGLEMMLMHPDAPAHS